MKKTTAPKQQQPRKKLHLSPSELQAIHGGKGVTVDSPAPGSKQP